MIAIPQIDGFDFEKYSTYEELETFFLTLSSEGVTVKNEGISSNEKNIYSFTVGDTSLPCVYHLFGIHGDHEWHGGHISAHYFKFLANPPQSHKTIVDWLKTKVHFYGIGFANTYGYEFSSYTNTNNVNLNRDFDYNHEGIPFTQPETKIVRDTFLERSPILFQDYHSRGGGITEGAYRYSNDGDRQDIEYWRDSVRSWTNATSIYRGTAGGESNAPTARAWAGAQKNHRSENTISILYEPPVESGPKEMSRRALTSFLVSAIYAANRVNYNVQSLYGHYDYSKNQ